ncbi:MFS transporter [Streptomyces sp. Vc74B-19]|uniref:MFS transporter n=1 Tax=Streptomyces sp. Vc74B-19 TaxID=2741324 RepID=UPI001BFC8D9C|nr:MFS transporter [Streptomyces sp. Vc74B-19]MBT3165200.1 MFS transporter [Streptomyces sp. Vc74B-19]
MPSLGTRGSFRTAGAVVAVALWTSACPTMTYPLYQAEWGISTTTVTWIFAAYPLTLIPVLLLLGHLADHLGTRVTMLLGLVAQLLGVLVFAVAGGVAWLLAGRVLMGLGVGLSIGPASLAMVEHSAPGREKRAGAVSTAVSALGIGLAMTVGGALTEYAPFPLHLGFFVLAGAIAAVACLVACMPRHTPHPAAGTRRRTRTITVPRGSRTVFVAGAIAFASSFLIGAIVLPLGAKIAQQLAGSTNALVTGALLAVFAGCITLFALLGRNLHVRPLVLLGAVGSVAAVWLYVLTGATHSLLLFFLASAVAGAAYAFDFAGGLTVLSRFAPAPHRAGMVSGGYLVGYAAQGVGAPALGAVVTAHGLMTGLVTGAAVFGAFFVLVAAVGLVVLTPVHRADCEAARHLPAPAQGAARTDAARAAE